MEFEWDESKRIANLDRHGIDFIDIPEVFEGDIVTVEDDLYSYREAMESGVLSPSVCCKGEL
jgi:hypothetical protein